ncbi:MAG: hypothetical protein JSS64_15435 [Bacteroidetes bacterium]|nr:hypothetical protein [Bacteroidota bacterium]
MDIELALNTLHKFRQVNKYETFREILPSTVFLPKRERELVTKILDHCAHDLILLLRQGNKKAIKKELKIVLIECMDALAIAKINSDNREFGYQLGWYLAEKVHINLKTGTEKKLWGYWQVEGFEVSVPIRPRISTKAKERVNNN